MDEKQLPWRGMIEAHLAQLEVAIASVRSQVEQDGARLQQLADRVSEIDGQ